MKPFYITTTLPYVNSNPHVGFAMEIIRADAIARYKKLLGHEVFFNTGTDEHGQKIWQKAEEEGIDPQEYVNQYAKKFKDLIPLLNISEDIHFIRTTDEAHKKAAQEFWKRCAEKGDIYKKNYNIKYCVGCELEKQDSDLDENGKCQVHPHLELEIREEENYFFKFSNYEEALKNLYKDNPTLVIPDFRFNEIKSFVDRGLNDFSISRPKQKMSWGVPVPGDDNHVMYVWFDALVNYISTLGWPDSENFKKFWEGGETVQYAGKDNLRQQSAMWQAMLMSAGIKNTDSIVINGFINSGGQKMSKSLGNVISPFDIVSEYGTDALRYYCLRELSNFEDSDMTLERFKEIYNANLANGLGNLVSRVMTMAVNNGIQARPQDLENLEQKKYLPGLERYLKSFEINKALDEIWEVIKEADTFIQTNQPFKKIKTDPAGGKINIETTLVYLIEIATRLEPFLPETSFKIKSLIKENKTPETPLFVRKD